MNEKISGKSPFKIFLTGPDGILGNNLIPVLLGKGFQVRALIQHHRSAEFTQSLGAETVFGDILNLDELLESMAGCDFVIHAAANTDIWPTQHPMISKVNVEGTRNVIQAVLSNNIRKMIHIGTANSFGPGTKLNPGNESLPFSCAKYKLEYINSKYEAQQLVLKAVKDSKLPAVIVNPTFMIGPFDFKPSSGKLIVSVYQNKVPGYTCGGRNYVYVKDVAVAIANALELGKPGESYILGNENLSYSEIFDKISGITGSKPVKMQLPDFAVLGMGMVFSILGKAFKFNPGISLPVAKISLDEHYYSSSKAVNQLGMPQTPIDTALQEAFNWLISSGYLT